MANQSNVCGRITAATPTNTRLSVRRCVPCGRRRARTGALRERQRPHGRAVRHPPAHRGIFERFIVADYLHVNKSNARQITEEEKRLGAGMTPDEHAILMSFLEARPSYLAAFFDEAETQYGSFKGFIERGLRLTPEQIDVLKFLIGS